MPKASLHIADEFIDGLTQIYSERLLARIKGILNSLMEFPQMGSPLVRRCLIEAYGEGIRQIAVSTYLIIYRYDGDSVDVLALVYGPTVI